MIPQNNFKGIDILYLCTNKRKEYIEKDKIE